MSHSLRTDSLQARASPRPRSSRGRGAHAHRNHAAATTTSLESLLVRVTATPVAVTSSSSDDGESLKRFPEYNVEEEEDGFEFDFGGDDDSYADMPPLIPPTRRGGDSTTTTTTGLGVAATRARSQRRPSSSLSSQQLRRRTTRSAARSSRTPTVFVELPSDDSDRPPPPCARGSARVAAPSSGTTSTPSDAPAASSRKPPPAPASQRKHAHGSSSSSSKKRAATATAGQASAHTPAQPAAKRARSSLKPPPNAKNDADYDDQESGKAAEKDAPDDVNCCICMSEPEPNEESTISGCEHRFCFGCIAKWSERENTCPLCKVRFTKICRVNPQKHSRGGKSSGPRVTNTKTVKQRDQRSDILSGPTLEGLLQSLAASAAGGPSHNMLDPFMRRLLNSGFITGGAGAARAFSLADFMNDSDDDDEDFDDDDNVFHPFSVMMRASTSHYRVGPFAPSFPAVSFVSVPPNGAGASNESSRTVPVADRASRQYTARVTTRTSHIPTRAARSTVLPSPPSSTGASRFAAVATAAAATARPARSYATNSGDSRAGQNLANPLEIDDSSDDEIQVVSVNYPHLPPPAFM